MRVEMPKRSAMTSCGSSSTRAAIRIAWLRGGSSLNAALKSASSERPTAIRYGFRIKRIVAQPPEVVDFHRGKDALFASLVVCGGVKRHPQKISLRIGYGRQAIETLKPEIGLM